MNTAVNKLERLSRTASQRSEKRSDKKRELALHAIAMLGELGYARTSLRDIAERSGVSVGVLHYYFEDKSDLISYCVKTYKQDFIEQIEAFTAAASTPALAVSAFIDALCLAVEKDAATHALWYDISAQAMFDTTFVAMKTEIERDLIAMVTRLLRDAGLRGADSLQVYFACDGAFRYYLQKRLAGDDNASSDLRDALTAIFEALTGE